ncbi:membrane protein insertion efficiency factor YidD [Pelagibacteraceae bacterium]|jgi:hypothetical protein|nr:membrane protein insertion efficiency factor YidD [Pelagibacteraceae bacterium]|tara:strand:+ start:231 stop:494 length:264 start_codon:yes stop_codon:yes gene_type:complete
MNKLVILFIINIIKFYKYFISPIFGSKCRYLPTCSDYFIEAINLHGIIYGSYLGFKRILRCHPIKLLGGSSGLDLVPNKKNSTKGSN